MYQHSGSEFANPSSCPLPRPKTDPFRLGVRPVQHVPLVVKIDSGGARAVRDDPHVGPPGVHPIHGLLMGEYQIEGAASVLGEAAVLPAQHVARGAGAGVAAVGVGAELVAEAPLRALVPVHAGPVVVRQLPSLGTVAGAAGQGRLALVFAAQRRTSQFRCKMGRGEREKITGKKMLRF